MIPEHGSKEECKRWVLDCLWAWTCGRGHQQIPDFEWVRTNEPPLKPGETMAWACVPCKHQWWVLQEQLHIERQNRLRLRKHFEEIGVLRSKIVDATGVVRHS